MFLNKREALRLPIHRLRYLTSTTSSSISNGDNVGIIARFNLNVSRNDAAVLGFSPSISIANTGWKF